MSLCHLIWCFCGFRMTDKRAGGGNCDNDNRAGILSLQVKRLQQSCDLLCIQLSDVHHFLIRILRYVRQPLYHPYRLTDRWGPRFFCPIFFYFWHQRLAVEQWLRHWRLESTNCSEVGRLWRAIQMFKVRHVWLVVWFWSLLINWTSWSNA